MTDNHSPVDRRKALGVFSRAALGAVALRTLGRSGDAAAQDIDIGIPVIDTQVYLVGRAPGIPGNHYESAVDEALETMDTLNFKRAIVMPPPFAINHLSLHDYDFFADILKVKADRFSYLGGGGQLNLIIQQAVRTNAVSPALKTDFEAKARAILAAGSMGFGEIGLEQLSFNKDQPYVSAPPDHPLVTQLADIAAESGVPMMVHMEAVVKEYTLAKVWAARTPNNPESLPANIEEFKKLLGANRKANIIWANTGWDNTGQRTPELLRELLAANPNLYMSIRIDRLSVAATRPLDNNSRLKPEWLKLLGDFSDRFMIGSGHQHMAAAFRLRKLPKSTETRSLIAQLPPELAAKIAHGNAARLFKLPTYKA